MELTSCIYECTVMHHRLAPREHHFEHGIFMFYLDLDELDEVDSRLHLFSCNRANVYAFRDRDHLPAGGATLKANVVEYLKEQGVDWDSRGRIKLLTLPRVLGYLFNPVSFYFCFDAAGQPVCAIAEVGNTFGEMKLYLLERPTESGGETFRRVVPKHFYVSPFSSLEWNFDFQLRPPGETMLQHVDDRDGAARVLVTTLTGKRAGLTNRNLYWFTLKYPLVTMKVIFLIHWQALQLYWKRVPFHRKAANPDLQTGVLHPHASLTGGSK